MNTASYELFKKYQVTDCGSMHQFIEKYHINASKLKNDEDDMYYHSLMDGFLAKLRRDGFVLLTKNMSTTHNFVAYYL